MLRQHAMACSGSIETIARPAIEAGLPEKRAFAFRRFRAGLEQFTGIRVAASLCCCYADNMPAILIQKRRYRLAENRLVDVSIWELPAPLFETPIPHPQQKPSDAAEANRALAIGGRVPRR